jgi:hypothetical protein
MSATWTVTPSKYYSEPGEARPKNVMLTIGFTDDDSPSDNESRALVASEYMPLIGYFLVGVVSVPSAGDTAPAAAWDVTIKNEDGIDLMGSGMLNRSATAAEWATPKPDGMNFMYPTLFGALTINISNTTTASSVVTLRLFFSKP